MKGLIVLDIDGTIALRDRAVEGSMADLLTSTTGCGWQVCFLTGQPFSNAEPRLVPSLLGAMNRQPCPDSSFRLFTCEGASGWLIDPSGCVRVPNVDQTGAIDSKDQVRISQILDKNLSGLLPPGAVVTREPQWIEEAMCVFKLDLLAQDRRVLAERLQALLRSHGFDSLRIGMGGTFSIVIAHETTHKGTALARLVKDCGFGEIAIYLADEFRDSGNDAVALEVNNLVCYDFNRHRVHKTGGPSAVARWLRRLIALSLSTDVPGDELVNRLPNPRRRIS